jgi:hypothetical protein
MLVGPGERGFGRPERHFSLDRGAQLLDLRAGEQQHYVDRPRHPRHLDHPFDVPVQIIKAFADGSPLIDATVIASRHPRRLSGYATA